MNSEECSEGDFIDFEDDSYWGDDKWIEDIKLILNIKFYNNEISLINNILDFLPKNKCNECNKIFIGDLYKCDCCLKTMCKTCQNKRMDF